MEKYYAHADSVKTDPSGFDYYVEVYLAGQVDARIVELEIAEVRYRKLRRLNPNDFTNLIKINIREGIPFDTLVDGLDN